LLAMAIFKPPKTSRLNLGLSLMIIQRPLHQQMHAISRLGAKATERREPSTSSARSAAMALMDNRSSEALASRASVPTFGETLKSWNLRGITSASLSFSRGSVSDPGGSRLLQDLRGPCRSRLAGDSRDAVSDLPIGIHPTLRQQRPYSEPNLKRSAEKPAASRVRRTLSTTS
jgi:hypothetical protein